jgi:hypothetical protein
LGINQCYRSLHHRVSRIRRTPHPALHQRAIQKQEKLISKQIWLFRTCLRTDATETGMHDQFELESYLV